MTDRKTVTAAAVLAAAAGVYFEISYQVKLGADARLRMLRGVAPVASARQPARPAPPGLAPSARAPLTTR
jgi:hypothetical protein